MSTTDEGEEGITDGDERWAVIRPAFVDVSNAGVPVDERTIVSANIEEPKGKRMVRPTLRNLLNPLALTSIVNPDPLAFVSPEERALLVHEEDKQYDADDEDDEKDVLAASARSISIWNNPAFPQLRGSLGRRQTFALSAAEFPRMPAEFSLRSARF